MKLLNVKGCIDYLPKEQLIRNYINRTLEETFKEFGYQSIETPILCYYDILSGKYDSNNDILKEIYRLKDQGNRDLGLRYDLTVPFAKFIALNKNKIDFPFKRYEIAKVFRDGPIKLGRDREFTQCDVDVVGISSQLIEAECLDLYVKAFKKLDILVDIKYNSRNLMRGLIISCGVSEELISSVITIIDKMDKLSKDEFNDLLMEVGLRKGQIKSLMNLFKMSLRELEDKYKNIDIEEINVGIKELRALSNYIEELGISDYCSLDLTLARGQDYYTGNVFEVYAKDGSLNCSIGGGGRYDNMITDYINDGNVYPAVGISFGLSSIYELLKDRELFNRKRLIDLYVIPMDNLVFSLKYADKLRDKGAKVLVEINNKKIKKAFSWADKHNIPYVLVIGDNEIETGKIVIRDMLSSNGIEIDIDDIDKVIEVLNIK